MMKAVHVVLGLALALACLSPHAFAAGKNLGLNAFLWLCKMDVPPGGVASRLEAGQLDLNLDLKKK